MFPSVYKYFAIAFLLFTVPLSTSSAEDYFSKLKAAVSDGDVNTVPHLLLQNSTDWLTETRGWEIARIAAEKGNLPMIQYIEKKNEQNQTIGHIAAKHGHSRITEYFLDKTRRDHWSPPGSETKSLFDSIIADKKPILFADKRSILFDLWKAPQVLDTLRSLKSTHEEAEITNWDRSRFESEVLRAAVDRDCLDVLRFMKYDVNTMNDEGELLILTAARLNRPKVFYYLADDGRTNLAALDRKGNNILFIAAMKHDVEKMRHILDTSKAPIDLEWRNQEGDTVLHVAVKNVPSQAKDYADKKKEMSKDVYYHYYHIEEVDNSVLEYLVEVKRVNIDALDRANKTALYHALSCTNYDVCNYLLSHGANPKLYNTNGHNFWHEIRFPSVETTSVKSTSSSKNFWDMAY